MSDDGGRATEHRRASFLLGAGAALLAVATGLVLVGLFFSPDPGPAGDAPGSRAQVAATPEPRGDAQADVARAVRARLERAARARRRARVAAARRRARAAAAAARVPARAPAAATPPATAEPLAAAAQATATSTPVATAAPVRTASSAPSSGGARPLPAPEGDPDLPSDAAPLPQPAAP